MAIDPVTLKLLRRPMFIVGVLFLIVGVVPLVLTLLLVPASSAVGPGMLMWICVPLGIALTWRAHSVAMREWRRGL